MASSTFDDRSAIADFVLEDIDVNVYVKSIDRRYIFVNAKTANTCHRAIGEMIGHTDAELFPANIADQWSRSDDTVFETGARRQAEESFIGPDGETSHFLSTKTLLRRPGREDCLLGYSVDITPLKRAEASLRDSIDALRNSESKFQQAFEFANAGMCLVDLSGRLLQVNSKMCQIFGYSKSELEATYVNDIAIQDDKALSPGYIESAKRGVHEAAAFEKRYRHKDGHLIYAIVSASLVHDQQGKPSFFVSQVQDITKSKQNENELRLSEERHRLLIENASDILWTLWPDGTLGHISKSVEQLIGYSVTEALQLRFTDFIGPESIKDASEYVAYAIRETEQGRKPDSFHKEVQQRRKDGSLFWTDILAFPITDSNGKLVEILGVTRDIEARRKHEQELKQARDDAQKAKAALERANAELNLLASIDALTGVANRRHFESIAIKQIELAKRYGETLCLVMFDIDHFKLINDRHGHQAGDKALIEIASTVRTHLRASDSLGRWGGEEFLILLPRCDLKGGMEIAEELRHRIEELAIRDIGTITASFGVAQWMRAEVISRLVSRVDNAMYAAKRAGRNRVVPHAES